MKIEEGKFYRTRSGEKRGPMRYDRLTRFPWKCGATGSTFTFEGDWKSSAMQTPNDLVAEWSEPVLSGPAVELSTLADLDAQPGDIVGHLKDGTLPRCAVFTVESGRSLANEKVHMPFRDSWDTHARFFMIHRAPRDAGGIDSSPSEFWASASELDVRVETREPIEPNPEHEAENSRDALLDGPDWRGHCRALLKVVDALVDASSDHFRARVVVRNAQHIGAAQRDLEAGQ